VVDGVCVGMHSRSIPKLRPSAISVLAPLFPEFRCSESRQGHRAGGGRMPSARSRASVRGRAGRVAREVQRAGELAFGDDDRAEGHVKFVG
jgi:hypothetical protein